MNTARKRRHPPQPVAGQQQVRELAMMMPNSPIIMKWPTPVRSRFVVAPNALTAAKVPAATKKRVVIESAV